MIDKMTKYSFILLSSEKEKFLQDLQELGVVDITRSSKPVDDKSAALLSRIESRKAEIADINSGSDNNLKAMQAALSELLSRKEEIRPWGTWDRDMLSETGIGLHFYSIDSRKYLDEWERQFAIQKVSEEDARTYFVVAGPNDGFPLKELPAPGATLAECENAVSDKQREMELYSKALDARRTEIPALQQELAAAKAELSRYLASQAGESAAEDSLAVFEGFAPASEDSTLEKQFDQLPTVWLRDPATAEDNPPIKLRNRPFVSMYEVLTDMYGRPAYGEFDPTVYISIFFTLFFAFCMGDCGYGLIITLLGLGAGKMLGKLKPLVVTLGIATMVIGFIFHTFFSIDISQWAWIQNLGLDKIMLPSKIYIAPMGAEYDWTMVLALIVGVFHLCVAFLVKAFYSVKQKGLKNSLATLGWTLLIVGGVIIGALAILKVLPAGVTKTVIIVIGVLSAIGIFFFNNPKANPVINFGNGLWATYNTATGLLGDVLSYLRLYALGLAGSMLGAAFNQLGMMVLGDSPGVVSWIFCILILIIGHALNIAMCVLGAFVHPLRLNFLEFFKNSDYQGSGRNYNPLTTNE